VPVVVVAETDDAGSPEHWRLAGDLLHERAQRLRVGALFLIRKRRDELVARGVGRLGSLPPLSRHPPILASVGWAGGPRAVQEGVPGCGRACSPGPFRVGARAPG